MASLLTSHVAQLLPYFHRFVVAELDQGPGTSVADAFYELWLAVLESHVPRIAAAYRVLGLSDDVFMIARTPEGLSCQRHVVANVPYIMVLWQEFQRDKGEFYVTTFRNAKASPADKAAVLELQRVIAEVSPERLFARISQIWSPTETLLIDCAFLYSIWAAVEVGTHADSGLYTKVLKCAHPSLPFVEVCLACQCLSDSVVRGLADVDSVELVDWSRYFECKEYLKHFDKDPLE